MAGVLLDVLESVREKDYSQSKIGFDCITRLEYCLENLHGLVFSYALVPPARYHLISPFINNSPSQPTLKTCYPQS